MRTSITLDPAIRSFTVLERRISRGSAGGYARTYVHSDPGDVVAFDYALVV
ncbi:hypothetical protein ACRQ5Q_27485 [Bradyrhizobium sp. PMVTL-01]|uniref:hypothetical protein n=1 Tax=Bradyrhizobium sp. PMVTL-01 TaxID=3434999 RepID=UPI003F71C372